MKKLLLLFVAGVAGLATVSANVEVKNSMPSEVMPSEIFAKSVALGADTTTQDSIKRTLLEPIDLPQSVQATLQSDEYLGWTIVTAYYVEEVGRDAYYEISLQQEGREDMRVVNLNSDGTLRDNEEN
jgi:hypothetical protein